MSFLSYFRIMIQLYFLSILCNGLSGYLLFSGNEGEAINSRTFSPVFYLVIGILSAVTGVLKLLSPTLDNIFILGDLLPAAAGVIAGGMLIFGIYRRSAPASSSEVSASGSLDSIAVNLLTFKKPIGISLLAIAVIHFLFPQALFL